MQLDLNLLTTLDALLEEGSVMGAAERLRLSSPAVSRALGRLRRLTGDDILVRSGRMMIPTPYAIAIREHVRDLVRQAHDVLKPDLDIGDTAAAVLHGRAEGLLTQPRALPCDGQLPSEAVPCRADCLGITQCRPPMRVDVALIMLWAADRAAHRWSHFSPRP